MLTTTLNKIDALNPCDDDRWEKLLKHLGKTQPDDEPLTYLTILESNGFEDALWCCRAVEDKYQRRMLIVMLVTESRKMRGIKRVQQK